MKSPKSQITMIIIVGLVLFILVGIIFYISKSAFKKTAQQGIKTTQTTALNTQPIKEFVSKCQDKLAKEAINLIGKQGGYIYKSQGGDLIDYSDGDQGKFFIIYDGNKVAYNIRQPHSYSVFPYSSVAPDYPWKLFPYKDISLSDKTFEGIFGLSNVPPLNISQGPNSLQSQVQDYIDNKMQDCVDLRPFVSEGYDFNLNKSRTTVTLASSDVRIKTVMPIKISNIATGEQTYIDTFSSTINVRLKEMYYFVNNLVGSDIGKITFNLKDDTNNKNAFRINVKENSFSKDDIVIVTDDKSQISGKPFEYRFARKNRAPALYYINPDSLTLSLGPSGEVVITKHVLLSGMDLQAEDPDEDTLNFNIDPDIPLTVDKPETIIFNVAVSDGQLSDYQQITVKVT